MTAQRATYAACRWHPLPPRRSPKSAARTGYVNGSTLSWEGQCREPQASRRSLASAPTAA